VYAMDSDGTNVKELTTNDNNYGNVFPRFSPDGKTVAYGELVNGTIQLAIVGADGTDAKVLTSQGANVYPRWSPDGKSIAYNRFEKDQAGALIVCDTDGKNPRELLRGSGIAEWKPK